MAMSEGAEQAGDTDLDYRLLRRMLSRRHGFNFILVQYQGDHSRDRLLARLTADLDGLGVDHLILDLRQHSDDVVLISAAGQMLEAHPIRDGRPRALSVIGLERHLDYRYGGTREGGTSLLADANLHRDLFAEQVPVPMALWGSALAQPAIAHIAPDLWHWRVGSADLTGDAGKQNRTTLLEAAITRPEQDWQYQDLPEARRRLALLRELIAEDETPSDDRGPLARRRAGLLRELGQLQFQLGETAAAEAALQEALALFARLADEREQADTWSDIADVAMQRGDLDTALSLSRDVILPLCLKLGEQRWVAITRGRIADIYQKRGDLDAALRIRREEELPVYERLGAARDAAVTRSKVADIYQMRGDLDAALRIRREEVLPVFERLGDARDLAVTRGRIADIYQMRGELDAALRIHREEVLPVFERLGGAREAAVTRGKIADIYEMRGDLDAALRIRREEVLPVYEHLGDARGMAVAQYKIAHILLATDPRGKRDEAVALLTAARDALARMGLPEATMVQRELDRLRAGGKVPPPVRKRR